jgi:hypothetical protein
MNGNNSCQPPSGRMEAASSEIVSFIFLVMDFVVSCWREERREFLMMDRVDSVSWG